MPRPFGPGPGGAGPHQSFHMLPQQQQQMGFPPQLPPGMPPFHTLPPHVQAHMLREQAMAHAHAQQQQRQQQQQQAVGGGGGGVGRGQPPLRSPGVPSYGGGPAPAGFPRMSPPPMPPPNHQQHQQQQQQQQQPGMSPMQHQGPGSPMMVPRGSAGMMPPMVMVPASSAAPSGLRPPPPPPPPPPSHFVRGPPQPQMLHPAMLQQQQQQLLQQQQQQQRQRQQGLTLPPGQGKPDARPPLPPIEMFPRGELMTAYDTRYVIMAQMRALDTPDPFNDDFYYHNAMRRKQEKSRREALMGLQPNSNVGAPAMPMPLPVWQETKEIAKKAKDDQADAVKKRIRQWESENRVLGHQARSDVHRPRALLVLSGAEGAESEEAGGESASATGDGDAPVSEGAPFETSLWRARLAIQRATNAMLAAYELNYLLHLPTTPPEKKAEVAARLGDVIVDLAVSLGLQRSTILQQADGKPAPDASTLEASLDLGVLSTVLELAKGQKLLSRCLAMLPPNQRSALVPSVLALTLARAPAASLRNAPSEQAKADAVRAEEALASELKNILQSPASLPLPILRRCVELVMTANRGRVGSLAAALGSVSRAEVLGAVLQKGGELSEAEGGEAAADWAALQGEFIAMAKEGTAAAAAAAAAAEGAAPAASTVQNKE
ncbi:unnamed protein product [Scytosiphon promiscuus]